MQLQGLIEEEERIGPGATWDVGSLSLWGGVSQSPRRTR